MVELTPEQLKKLEQLARIEKNPTLEIIKNGELIIIWKQS
jgi:hypothetical protein